MPIDIALIAASAVGSILLPFFQRTGEKVAADIGQRVGDDAAEYATGTARRLWERIKGRLSASDEGRMISERFERNPEAAAPLLEADLKQKLAEDQGFAEEIAELIQAESPDGSGNVMQIFGKGGIVDARGAHVEGGFIAGYVENVHGGGGRPQSDTSPDPASEPREV
jgi:hypothetical protein